MTVLDELLAARILTFKHGQANLGHLIDRVIAADQPPQFKNVCAPMPIQLVDRLENALAIMDMSKREFITMAVCDALERYDALYRQYDVDQAIRDNEENPRMVIVQSRPFDGDTQ